MYMCVPGGYSMLKFKSFALSNFLTIPFQQIAEERRQKTEAEEALKDAERNLKNVQLKVSCLISM